MLGLIILSTFLILLFLIIFMEYRNEKKYQETRRQKNSPIPRKDEPNKTESVVAVPSQPLPEANYPAFDHHRLVDMGLSEEEAKEFVCELIPQIEIQLPLIREALHVQDYLAMERLTHSIKGSATNIGTGGVSDLLVAYNTYLKTGNDFTIAEAYLKHLTHYTNELKLQYN